MKAIVCFFAGETMIGNGVLVNVKSSGKMGVIVNKHNMERASSYTKNLEPSTKAVPIMDNVKWDIFGHPDCVMITSGLNLTGLKPLPVVAPNFSETGSFDASYWGFNPKSRELETGHCRYIYRNGEIFHNASTDKGSCGGFLLDHDGSVLGMHWRGKTGDKSYPNACFPILNFKPPK